MSMPNPTVTCPHCQLRHAVAVDGHCPQCRKAPDDVLLQDVYPERSPAQRQQRDNVVLGVLLLGVVGAVVGGFMWLTW